MRKRSAPGLLINKTQRSLKYLRERLLSFKLKSKRPWLILTLHSFCLRPRSCIMRFATLSHSTKTSKKSFETGRTESATKIMGALTTLLLSSLGRVAMQRQRVWEILRTGTIRKHILRSINREQKLESQPFRMSYSLTKLSMPKKLSISKLRLPNNKNRFDDYLHLR